MPLSRWFPIVAAVAAFAGPVRADVLYVDDDAPPGGDGLGWGSAYRSVKVALDAARVPGAAVTEIRVAQGTYRFVQAPGPESDCCEAHDAPGCNAPTCEALVCFYIPYCCETTWDATCVALAEVGCGALCDEDPLPPPPTYILPDGVALRGGYAGVGAPDPDARDVDAYPTVLDGDVGMDDDLFPESCCAPHDTPGCDDPSPDGACEAAVCADLPYCCETAWDLLCVAVALDPYTCYNYKATCPEIANNAQVVTAIETGPTTVLDGLTVTRGAPGVFVEGGAPSIVDCRIVNNRIYGVAATSQADPTIVGCTFSGNAGYALVLYLTYGTVTDCLLTENASWFSGGGLYAYGGSTIIDCTVTNNRAAGTGGGIRVEGGAVIGCTISGNQSIAGRGGGGYVSAPVIDCVFSGNESGDAGGGLWVSGDVIGCIFDGNSAGDHGGGGVAVQYYISDLHIPRVVNCVFVGNSGECGGGLIGDYEVILVNCTFSGNSAVSGGAVCLGERSAAVNCVLWGNTPDEVSVWGDPEDVVAFSDVQGGFPGLGNIDADPRFVDLAAGDVRLGPDSPCIDAGRNIMIGAGNGLQSVPCDLFDLDRDGDTTELIPIDLEGRLRFADDPATPDTGCAAGAPIDMGAYEFGAPPDGDRVVCGDVDGDGEVGVRDLLIVLAAWGPCADPCCLADVPIHFAPCRVLDPPDGVVDVADFYGILSWWGL